MELGFNVDEYDAPTGELAAGEYVSCLSDFEEKELSTGNGTGVACRFTVLNGDAKDRTFFEFLNTGHHNEQVAAWAKQKVRSLSDACGLNPKAVKDWSELVNIPIRVTRKPSKKDGSLKNYFAPYGEEARVPAQETKRTKKNGTNKPNWGN